ncbi:unnamed protein product, partial [Effrenium voratum]
MRAVVALSSRWRVRPAPRANLARAFSNGPCVRLEQRIEADGSHRTGGVADAGRVLVEHLNLTVQGGQRWALLGPNGSGKSTVAKALLKKWADQGSAAYVSFDLQRQMLQDERRDFLESRYESRHLRATVASYLFPDCYPDDPAHDPVTWGYRPPRTRTSPLPVPYDADSEHPLLRPLEVAASTGEAARLLHFFGLWQLRHRPLFALSTGEGRKLLMVDALLKRPSLLVLDEAFDGLDVTSRKELASQVQSFFEGSQRALVMILHRAEDLAPLPSHALLLGQGPEQTSYCAGAWEDMERQVRAFLAAAACEPTDLGPVAQGPVGEPLVEFKDVTLEYGPVRVLDKLNWTVCQGEKWVVVGGNGTGKTTLFDLITGENVLL